MHLFALRGKLEFGFAAFYGYVAESVPLIFVDKIFVAMRKIVKFHRLHGDFDFPFTFKVVAAYNECAFFIGRNHSRKQL